MIMRDTGGSRAGILWFVVWVTGAGVCVEGLGGDVLI